MTSASQPVEVEARWARAAAAFDTARLVYAITTIYAVFLAAAGVLRHLSFNSGHFDLGNMTQAVWSTTEGRFLETTEMVSGVQFSRLGSHVDPILAAFVPLWTVWPSPLIFVVVQAVALSLGALPVFWLARKHFGSPRIAARFVVAYLLYPAVQWNALSDFHAVSLAVPLLLFAIWYLDEDNFLAFLPFGILAAATKEHVPLVVGWLGIWYAIRKGRRLAGAAVATAGVVWFAVAVFVILPLYAPAGVDHFADRFGHLGGSPSALAAAFVTDPIRVLEEVATVRDVGYLLVLLGPLCMFWALEPLLVIGALPQIGMNLLSNLPQQLDVSSWYTAAVIPFAFGAAALGGARLSPARRQRWSKVLVAAVAATMVLSPLLYIPFWAADAVSPEREARAAAVHLVPRGVPVSTTNQLGAHLSDRERIFGFPVICDAEWIAVDRKDPFVPKWVRARTGSFAESLSALRRDPNWRLVYSREGVLVFRRLSPEGASSGSCPGRQ